MRGDRIADFAETYEQRLGDFEQLRTICFGMIQNALDQGSVESLSLQSRVKTKDSATKKAESKKYDAPLDEITDFVALRIIVFLDRDVDRAAAIVEKLFSVDASNSIDKRRPDRVDAVGYRSLHLVCSLGKDREHLEEYKRFSGIFFEVQIRTALQHAWAEIEHKRRYKGNESLPKDLQHRLMALSGTLELVDREFSAIATAADEYVEAIQNEQSDEKNDDSLSAIAIIALYDNSVRPHLLSNRVRSNKEELNVGQVVVVQQELQNFGINSVGQLKSLLKSSNVQRIVNAAEETKVALRVASFFRTAMIAKDVKRYFEKAFDNSFRSIDIHDVAFLEKATGHKDIQATFEVAGVEIIPF